MFPIHVAGLKKPSGGGTYTQQQTQGNDSDSNWLGDQSADKYLAGDFNASSSYGLRKVTVHLLKTGSPTFTITAKIYTDVTGAPGVQTGSDSTTTLSSSTLTGSFAAYDFIFPSDISLTNTTKYWVVLVANTLGDGSNFVRWSGNPSGTHSQDNSANGLTWGTVQSSMDATITTYSFA